MLSFNFLELQGFRSFSKKQRFSFTNYDAGLYYVSGENRVEPDLGSNGSGKSSLLSDAVVWGLTGKTSLNLKAGNVKSWDDRIKCVVSLGFNKNGLDYEVTRSWNPNRLDLIVGKEKIKSISQEELEDLIGFNHASILHSIVLSQFSSKFLDFRPEEKLRIFSDIIGDMDKWLDFSKKASLKVQDIDSQILELEKVLDNNKGKIESLEDQDYENQIEEWNFNNKKELVDLENGIEAIEDDIKVYRNKVKKRDLLLVEKNTVTTKVIKNFDRINVRLDLINQNLDSLHLNSVEGDTKIKHFKNQIKALNSLGNSCPTCQQEVKEDYIKTITIDLEDILGSTIEEVKVVLDKTHEFEEKRNELVDVSKIEKVKKRELEEEIRELVYEQKSFNVELKGFNKELKLFEEDLKNKKIEKNPYLSLLEDNKKKIKKLEAKLIEVENEVEELTTERTTNNYWVDGFKKIRLLIIKEALDEFEICINNNLQELGLHAWKIRLDVDRETKSKTIKKGFHVFIESPTKKEYVPFECYCGGERGRLKLAGVLGLIDFINNRKGSGCNVEIYDEPTTHLSTEGESDLIEILTRRAKENNKKIFFIDHKDFSSYGEFDGIINVVKDENGSYIEV